MLGLIQVTYSDRKKRPINKVGRINVVDNNDTKIVDKVAHESECSITSWSKSGI